MDPSEQALARRARRAYEWGRVVRGLRLAVAAAPMVLFAAVVHRSCAWGSPVVIGSVLVAVVVAFTWRGGAAARAVPTGLMAGAVPLLLPFATGVLGGACGSHYCSLAFLSCIGGGVIAGFWIAGASLRQRGERSRFLLAGGTVAALAGSLGCLIGGAVGVAGMSVALLATSAPSLLVPRRA